MNNWKSRLKEQEWKVSQKHPYHRAVKRELPKKKPKKRFDRKK